MESVLNRINVESFNCKNLKSSLPEIHNLCCRNDVVILQETWLFKSEMTRLKNIHADFDGQGISSMDASKRLIIG